MSTLRALSLSQPWATLVAIGAKKIETRSWYTSYRGELAIHAAKRFPVEAKQACLRDPFNHVLHEAGFRRTSDLPLGVIVAVCRLVDCVPTHFQVEYKLTPQERAFGKLSDGRYAWLLEDARALKKPIPARGRLGLWYVPLEIVEQLEQ